MPHPRSTSGDSAPTEIIGGRQFAFAKYPADESAELEVQLISYCGEALPKAMGAMGASEEEQQAATLSAIALLAKALRAEGKGATTALFKYVFSYTFTDVDGKGRPVTMEDFYGRSAEEKWTVLWASLKVNYQSFFDAIRSRLKAAGEKPTRSS